MVFGIDIGGVDVDVLCCDWGRDSIEEEFFDGRDALRF